jgi:hypothetical protein
MESKYVACSAALQYIILEMDLLKEMQDCIYNMEGNLYIKCKFFADNSGASEPEKTAKHWPRTRCINAAGQHFGSYVICGNWLHPAHYWQFGYILPKQVSKADF